MAGTIYSGTYTTLIALSNPATQRTATVTGKITDTSGQGIFGNADFAWTVDNRGTIEATGSTSGFGIQLLAGGTIDNLVTGSVTPSGVSGEALIAGYSDGILIEFAPGIVTNLGEIEGTGANGIGIDMNAGGSVVNGSAAATSALISGVSNAVLVGGGVGAVTNFGTIASADSHTTVFLKAGGSVANGSSTSTTALISNTGSANGVYVGYGAGTVTNFGTVKGGSDGVFLDDGGRVANGRSGSTAGLIVGTTGGAIAIAGTTGTVVNFGTLENAGSLANVALLEGGSVSNGAAGATGASITGPGTGIYINNAPGTVTNFGKIISTSAASGNGIVTEHGGSITNFGTVQNTSTNAAIYLHAGGSVTNSRTGVSVGLISGDGNGIAFRGGVGTVTNSGSIKSSAENGVYLNGGGTVTNQAGGLIAGHLDGIYNRGVAVSVVNAGLIETTGTLDGIYLRGGGSVTNNAGATIAGSAAGVALGQAGGVVTNSGIIKGVIGFYGGIHHEGNTTLINFGTVASTSTATGAVAVQMGSSVGTKALVVEKGAVFTGLVEGGGRGEIEFAAAGTAAMGANISGFNTVALANGGADSLTLANANFTGVDGRITVIGGDDGNTVNASTVTTGQLTIDGGAGADVLTGSANGSTIFVFTAATLTAADKITGTGYNNELEVTTPGTIAVAGVTAVQIYRLANGGANSLTLTNANFTDVLARPINIYGGTGGNTINGSGLTGTTDNLDIYGGAGADVLKGGAGNDIFVFTAANLTKTDTVSGGGGNNELLMTTAGAIAANGVSEVETYVLADGAANTLSLAAANFAVAGSTITVADGNNGNTVSAAGVAAPDRIVVYAGGGADVLTGGAGNDVFYAGGDTTMTGGAGANLFVFSAAGSNTIADFTASASNEMEFVSGSGFVLPGATATPKPLGSLFVQDAAGSFTAATEHFAYGTTDGNLYYSASGATAGEELVTHLTGDPTLSASQISHFLFVT